MPRITDYSKKTTIVKKPVKGVKWEQEEPKGSQRAQLYKTCPKCMLVVDKKETELKKYKFPVCTKPSKSPEVCELNCTGILAANRRSRLTKKYPEVQKLTKELLEKFKCTKASVEREKKALELKNKKK